MLATLDFAWSAPSFLRESDFTGLFLSLIKKLLVISFFYAVLINGQVWIPAIVNSFAQLGANAAGVPLAQSPSDIMMQGIQIVRTCSRRCLDGPVDTAGWRDHYDPRPVSCLRLTSSSRSTTL